MKLEIIYEDRRWTSVPDFSSLLQKTFRKTLAHLPEKFHFPCAVTLLLTDDAEIQGLNRTFRGIDKPTDVLSFPQFEPHELAKKGQRQKALYVGDIVFAYQYIVDESKKEHKILINHIRHLLIHGLLHLFGYDHLSQKDAKSMERLEKKIMAELGLPDPYGDPAEALRRRPRKAQRPSTPVAKRR